MLNCGNQGKRIAFEEQIRGKGENGGNIERNEEWWELGGKNGEGTGAEEKGKRGMGRERRGGERDGSGGKRVEEREDKGRLMKGDGGGRLSHSTQEMIFIRPYIRPSGWEFLDPPS